MSTDGSTLLRFTITDDERSQVLDAVERIRRSFPSAADPGLHRRAPLHAARHLPLRLVEFLHEFRTGEPAGACVISGWTVDDAAVGSTPASWRDPDRGRTTADHELFLALLSSVLGEVYGWSTVQQGHLIQDLAPVRGEELEKSAGSSDSVLDLHTEDAFSAVRCDYIGLLCLRNDDGVPTVYSSVDRVRLAPQHLRVLAESRFVLTPDTEHTRRAEERGHELPPAARTPLLFGDPAAPYLVFDDFYVETDDGDVEARDALAALSDELRRGERDVVLAPGEVLFLDNYRAVHGRRPFPARYDGRDRWLKRVLVTRDLRRSRTVRSSVLGRVVEADRAT